MLTNKGTVTERWRLQFTSSTAFQLYGETRGLVGTGDINNDFAPANPNFAGFPYFTIDKDGFGTGWANGNVLRFDTVGANFPIWFIRCTLNGPDTVPTDFFRFQVRGDVNTP